MVLPNTKNVVRLNVMSQSINEDVKELSLLQRIIKNCMESRKNEESRTVFKIYPNRILAEIHIIIKAEVNEKVKNTMWELENIAKW